MFSFKVTSAVFAAFCIGLMMMMLGSVDAERDKGGSTIIIGGERGGGGGGFGGDGGMFKICKNFLKY